MTDDKIRPVIVPPVSGKNELSFVTVKAPFDAVTAVTALPVPVVVAVISAFAAITAPAYGCQYGPMKLGVVLKLYLFSSTRLMYADFSSFDKSTAPLG